MNIFRLASIAALTFSIISCDHRAVHRSDIPLSRADALKQLELVLPASARDIYYLELSEGMQVWERYVRFDVDPQDLDAAVKDILSDNDRWAGKSLTYTRSEIDLEYFPAIRSELMPMVWWDPDSVKNGYYIGSYDMMPLHILVDEDSSRIYTYQSD